MRLMRRLLLGSGFLLFIAVLGIGALVGPFYARVQHFAADPAAGYHSDFYVYVSPDAERAAADGRVATVLVQPNNSGTNSDDASVHRRDAWWTTYGRSKVADDLGVVLVVPAFPRPAVDGKVYTHALDRDVLTTTRADLARLDLQLLAMVDQARARLAADGIPSRPRLLLQGYSASGMFTNRFAALHPRRVLAVAAGSPGGWPIAPSTLPASRDLPYPAGTADLEALTGAAFDAQAWRKLPQLLVMGDRDDNDSLDFGDGWDKAAAAQVDRRFGDEPQARWQAAQRLYAEAGANARFELVEGVGHDRRALQPLTTEFFRKVLAEQSVPANATVAAAE